MAASGYDDVLTSIAPRVGHGSGDAVTWQISVPYLGAGLEIERPEGRIRRCSDKNQPARRRHRPTHVRHAGWNWQMAGDAERTLIARCAESAPPDDLPSTQIEHRDVPV